MPINSKKQYREYIDYYNEGDRVVFTALFHIKRGFCCGCKCLNCVYVPKYEKNNTKVHDNFKNLINLCKDNTNSAS